MDVKEKEAGGPGRGWRGDPQGHSRAGKIGGSKVAEDRDHMAEIGRRGGSSISADRQHMAEIGRKGGSNRGKGKKKSAGADSKV